MSPKDFPLRWESTGDEWWFASPIDWAAANGHYDLVRRLIHIDNDLLFKLTSLARIRRLETVWDDDDDERFNDVARCRSEVARDLFREWETLRGRNSLIRAGYGGWLLYTAASGGDLVFVRELLDRDPLLVFGEGEYGVTDIFYAAARSKSCEVFWAVFDCCLSTATRGRREEVSSDFRWEMTNRAVHAAARGGNLDILMELLTDGSDVLAYRDNQGSTVLHTAAGRGQVDVVKTLISSYDIITSVDNRGNTALNVAAYRGHLPVVEALITASPSLLPSTNKYGDTFIHMAVAGFRTPTFQRLDRQTTLVKTLLSGSLVKVEDLINVQNSDGRTPLHAAVIENVRSDIVELIMSVRYVDINIRDCEGNTPLDILNQRPRSASSEILIKRLISSGGFLSYSRDENTRNALSSRPRLHGIGSPGTSFRIPDAELVLRGGIEDARRSSCELTSIGTESGHFGEIKATTCSTSESNTLNHKKLSSTSSSTDGRFRNFLRRLGKKRERNANGFDLEEDRLSFKSYSMCSTSRSSPVPLRQQFSSDNKRMLSLQGNPSSKSAKKKFTTHDVRQVLPRSNLGSPCSALSESSWSSPPLYGDKTMSTSVGSVSAGPSSSSPSPYLEKFKMKRKHGSFNLRSVNSYFCIGTHVQAVENPINSKPHCQNERSIVV